LLSHKWNNIDVNIDVNINESPIILLYQLCDQYGWSDDNSPIWKRRLWKSDNMKIILEVVYL